MEKEDGSRSAGQVSNFGRVQQPSTQPNNNSNHVGDGNNIPQISVQSANEADLILTIPEVSDNTAPLRLESPDNPIDLQNTKTSLR